MMKIMTTVILSTLLASAIMMLCVMISKTMNSDREKSSPFECGFDPKTTPRLPFSLQFFLIAVLFLIFDIEVVIILPMITTMKLCNNMTWMITVTVSLMIILIGLYYEWSEGMLEWSY
uniref:NADH-ubiquinone oxidoreductase chain 3 n=1 Tax=Antilochus coquebertii TaxID=1577200 RepID=A0A4Y1JW18_9HEMI|nr:NADH dehydrogenase subunit 3 [Antilochus coquebertii]APO08969.1 NADH dehydrogenase subunit 3 [Antilochus coquebertii]